MGEKSINQAIEKIKAIIFDFDFTLVNSSKGIEKCITHALRMLDLPIPPTDEMLKNIGFSLEHKFLELADHQNSNKTRAFIQFFQEKADEVMNDFTHVFKEVPEIMSLLKEQGFSPGIVSGKFRYRIESFLEREKLLDFFKVIVGGEDVVKHKPLYFSK